MASLAPASSASSTDTGIPSSSSSSREPPLMGKVVLPAALGRASIRVGPCYHRHGHVLPQAIVRCYQPRSTYGAVTGVWRRFEQRWVLLPSASACATGRAAVLP